MQAPKILQHAQLDAADVDTQVGKVSPDASTLLLCRNLQMQVTDLQAQVTALSARVAELGG